MPWKMSWRVEIDGREVSDRWNPYLISIETVDKAGTSTDSAELVFDNTDGQVLFPEKGTPIKIYLDNEMSFEGFTDEPRSSGARGQGRRFSVSCKGFDPKGKAKQRLDFHKDDATLQDFLSDAGKRAGITSVKVDKALGSIKRDYWEAGGRSFLHLGQTLANELGATFKVRGDKAVMAKRGEGKSASGQSLPKITARWGDNLMSWDISPNMGRDQHAKTRIRYFDRKAASFKEEDVEIKSGEGAPQATDLGRFDAPDKAGAKDKGNGNKTKAERETGGGTIRIDCDPRAKAEGSVTLEGADPGVDGDYRMETATHKLTRDGGSETSLSVKQPSGEAGKDSRRAKKTTS
jgi:phage protein D